MSFRDFAKDAISRAMLFPLRFLMRRGRQNFVMRYIVDAIKILDAEGDEYVSLYRRPKTSSQIVLIEQPNEINKVSAIVMQGPLCGEDNFTAETVRLYGKLYPDVLVVVSTWKDEDSKIIEELLNEKNCEVVLNEYPEHSGILNLNYQVVSTLGGIKKAKELGKQFVFKTENFAAFNRY